MKRPLVIIGFYYILGIILGRYLDFNINIVLVFLFTGYITFLYYKKHKWKGSVLFFVLFLLGFVLSYNKFNHISSINKFVNGKENVFINAEVKEVTEKLFGEIIVVASVNRIYLSEELLEKDSISRKVNIAVSLKEEEKIHIGEGLVIKGQLQDLDEARNLGGYSEKNTYMGKNISYKMFGEVVYRNGISNGLTKHMEEFKERLINIYDLALSEEKAGIMKAMILGYEKDLDKDIKQLYINSGIYHIISISGTHISILILFIMMILKKIFSSKFSKVITIIFLVLYCIFTGANPGVVRATISGCVILIGDILYRESDMLTTLSLSAILILIYNPATLWNISFQLSYGALLGMILFSEGVYRLLTILTRNSKLFSSDLILVPLSSSLGIEIVLMPISLYHFFNVYPYSSLANLGVFMTSSLLIIIGFLLGVIGLININLISFLSIIIEMIINFYNGLSKLIYSLPLAAINIGRPKWIYILIYIGFVFVSFYYLSKYNKDFKKLKKAVLYFILIFIVTLLLDNIFQAPFSMTLLDVGQGDSTVVNYNKKTFVIDGGENGYTLRNHLNYKGINNVEGIFISHTDSDHVGGILEIIKYKKINKIFLPDIEYKDDDNYEKIMNLTREHNINVHFITSGDIINFDTNLSFYCINPKKDLSYDNNNSSMVLKMIYKNISCLFTGDIEKESEDDIIKENHDLKSDILKVSHHGSKTSTSEEFVSRVSPMLSLIGVGKNNRYNHPNDEVISRLLENGSKIYRTDKHGDVVIFLDNGTYKVEKTLR